MPFHVDQSAKVQNNLNINTKLVSILDKGETSTSFEHSDFASPMSLGRAFHKLGAVT